MPAVVAALGILSIILLLWVDRISERLRNGDVIEDALMDMQIHTATYHLRLEEALTGNVPVTVKEALDALDQAISLVDVTLNGGESEHKRVLRPLTEPELRVRAEEIKSLLVKFKILGLERQQKSDKSGSGSVLEQEFHAVFMKALSKARALEDIIERNEAENLAKYRRLFLGILIIWVFSVMVATAGIWNRELRRRSAVAALVKANEQLLSQAEELRGHREHLAELVEKRTRELTDVNERFKLEIVEHTKAEEALKESQRQLRYLSSQILSAEERERMRISRELHDELGQALNVMKLQLRFVEKRLNKDQGAVRDDCENILNNIDQLIEDVRRISRDLSPSILEDLGLSAALRLLISNAARNYGVEITSDIIELDHFFSKDTKIVIYRIFQEALTNIGKHARAGKASVVVRKQEGSLTFSVEDDGRGFDTLQVGEKYPSGRGLGLAIMNERISMLGGVFDLRSQKGKGTWITFSIPIDKGESG